MNVAMRQTMTLEQFLAWEDRQELRYEFDGLRPVAMTGGTVAHASIQINLTSALHRRLVGKPCRAVGSHLKMAVAGRVRYPDAFVVCNKMLLDAKIATEPVVVFEILSPSTAGTDTLIKNAEYRATPSIQRYVIVQQACAGAVAFVRRGEDWLTELVSGEAAVLCLPEIGIEIPLAELYADVELTGEPDADPP